MQPQQSPYPHIPYPPAQNGDSTPLAATARKNRRRTVAIAATALVAVGAVAGVAFGVQSGTTNGIGSTAALPAIDQQGIDPNFGRGSNPNGSANGATGPTSTGTATAAQSVGVVDINTVLGYQGARAAGTGIVLTSSGEIVTNNHVVDGATQISVTVVSTGQTYSATVVGTDPTDDVAVIQLSNASGLQTAALGDSSTVRVGATVTGVGNAGGTGGTPSSATGQVVALNQQLTASDTNGQNAEQLTGMIEINAPIEAGDSGGPLYNSSGKIIGIDTAAQTNGGTTTVAYAIPIAKALGIASQIESGAGVEHHPHRPAGLPRRLGRRHGAGRNDRERGVRWPRGESRLGGRGCDHVRQRVTVTSGTTLKSVLSTANPGDRISIGWTDTSGGTHQSSATLIAGPAD